MEQQNYSELRARAMKWLSSGRDFDRGIAILQETGFRPTVVRVLARQGHGAPLGMERLVMLMRDFIKLWTGTTSDEDTDEVLGVVNGQELGSAAPADTPKSIFRANADRLPATLTEVVKMYRESYALRDRLQRQMYEIGEGNDEASVERRKALSDAIKVQSDLQDKLYPFYAKYLENGQIPSEDEVKRELKVEPKVEAQPKRKDIEAEASELDKMSKEELQKLRKSIATKILRARNMLAYQAETKQKKQNPIPEGDVRRVKYESKITRLEARVKEIEVAIARLA